MNQIPQANRDAISPTPTLCGAVKIKERTEGELEFIRISESKLKELTDSFLGKYKNSKLWEFALPILIAVVTPLVTCDKINGIWIISGEVVRVVFILASAISLWFTIYGIIKVCIIGKVTSQTLIDDIKKACPNINKVIQYGDDETISSRSDGREKIIRRAAQQLPNLHINKNGGRNRAAKHRPQKRK